MDSTPKWYKLKGVRAGQVVSSYVLMNIDLMTEEQSKINTRMPLKSKSQIEYIFRANMYAAYDLF